MESKKLTLHKETIRTLTQNQLGDVMGGQGGDNALTHTVPGCNCHTYSVPGCLCQNTNETVCAC